MNDFDNTPIMPSSSGTPGPMGWIQTWIKAITQPNERSFVEIINSPEATQKTAFIWVFIAGTVAGLTQAVVNTISLATGAASPLSSIPGLEQYFPSGGGNTDITTLATTLFTGICSAPIAGLVSILFFALGIAIIQWIAKLFGGTGSFEKLAYAFAAISTPMALISVVLSFIAVIPYVGFCGSILSFGLAIYSFYLQVTATKAVNNFGWGQAAGSVLIPLAVVFLFLCCCAVIGIGAFGSIIVSSQ